MTIRTCKDAVVSMRGDVEPDRYDALVILAEATDRLNEHESTNVQFVGSLLGVIFLAAIQGSDTLKQIGVLFKIFVIPAQHAHFDKSSTGGGDEPHGNDRLFDK